ncbi:hypothetical protein [Alistipes sp.]|uniref:hypothetical protein n=1 Tax=Alistipes sp. TaxID=1872444 RepID=UPI003AEFDCFA
MKPDRFLPIAFLVVGVCAHTVLFADPIDLSGARIAVVGDDALVRKSAEVLSDQAARRTQSRLPVDDAADECGILLGLECDLLARFPDLAEPLGALPATGPEGYKLLRSGERVVVAGHDPRGVLYGAGRLLRLCDMRPGSLLLRDFSPLSSTPRYAIRGHELHPSPRAASPDEQWAKDNFEQYVRELALFGMNSIEMLRHVPADYVRIAKSYGLDVWIVTYDNGPDFESAEGEATELRMRENIFRRLPAIDHWCMKSGDPGELTLERFFAFSEKEVALLKRYHPEARVWLSPQHFVDAPMSYFEEFCRRANAVDWADGVVFGPWCRMPFAELRAKIRPELPIRNFPDITHLYACQYPARALDLPLAMTLGRICINPAPVQQKHIHNLFAPLGAGSLTYSEGTNDDLHKFFWLMQDWDSEMTAREAVRDYARYFIGPDLAEAFTEGIFALERNLAGPLAENEGILPTLGQWQAMEQRAGEAATGNPRFLMPLLRAHYDAYIYQRWLHELEIERRAFAALAEAPKRGSSGAAARARKILAEADRKPVAQELEKRCRALYEAVYRDEGRWTMEYQHCPLMDQIDLPLNDRKWIEMRLDEIDALPTNRERVAAIDRLVNRTDPGEGGIYYNLGDFSSEHVAGIDAAWERDPSHLETPHCGLGAKMKKGFVMTHLGFDGKPVPRAWLTQAGIYYDRPLRLTFEGFDPAATYRVRVVYVGEANKFRSHVQLEADGQTVHGPIRLDGDVVREFDLPADAARDGRITLTWRCNEGERGVHVAELFFLKNQPLKP